MRVASHGRSCTLIPDLNKLCREVRLSEALKVMDLMDKQGIFIPRDIMYVFLQGCAEKKDLAAGRQVHMLIATIGADPIVGDNLIRMYASCGNLLEASRVFCEASRPSMYKWNAIISAYAKNAEGKTALKLYNEMQQQGINPDKATYLSVLKACSGLRSLRQGILIHNQTIDCGLEADVVVGSTLIDMYCKCGRLDLAQMVFDKLVHRNVVSWGVMIAGYAQYGHILTAIELFDNMQKEGIEPDRVIFLCISKACSTTGAIGLGRLAHNQIISSGFDSDIAVGSTLVDMYVKCESLEEAHSVFGKLPIRNVVSWSALIAGYAQHGHGIVALELFERMQQDGIKPGRVAFFGILQACASIGAVEQGGLIHAHIIQSGLDPDLDIGSSLVDMYAKCGNLAEAQKVFDKCPNKTLESWSALLGGYVQLGQGLPALELCEKMQQDGIKPDRVAFISILKACSSIQSKSWGKYVHHQIIRDGLQLDVVLGSTIVDMYAKCDCLDEAWVVFEELPTQNVVSWGAILTGVLQHGHCHLVLQLYETMRHEGIKPDKVLFLCVLKACSRVGAFEQGRRIHEQASSSGLQSDLAVGSSLVNMYAKGGNIVEARRVFDQLDNRNAMAWGAMIAYYTQKRQAFSALELFENMHQERVKPEKATFLCILKACGTIGALVKGRLIHEQIIKTRFDSDVVVGNTLTDMYSKCGSLEEAQEVFDHLLKQDVVSWGALIAGYATSGSYRLASQCLQDMQQQGFKPDGVIFTIILSACSHAGLIKEGYECLQTMSKEYGIIPNIEHYNCIIDLLGRAGCLNEAKSLLQSMELLPNAVSWTSLLMSCRTYSNIELARQCFDEMVQLDANEATGYVIVSNIYADAYKWEEVEKIKEMRKSACACKEPGIAWIEIKEKIHEFIVGGKSHSQSFDMHAKLKRITRVFKWEGSVPQVDVVLEPDSDTDHELAFN